MDLKKALSFLLDRLLTKQKPWEYQQIIPFDEATLIPLIIESRKQFLQIQDKSIDTLEMKCNLLKSFL